MDGAAGLREEKLRRRSRDVLQGLLYLRMVWLDVRYSNVGFEGLVFESDAFIAGKAP